MDTGARAAAAAGGRGDGQGPRGTGPADAAAWSPSCGSVAAGAYGEDWESRGRSQLGEAALLLAALLADRRGTGAARHHDRAGAAQPERGSHSAQGSQSQSASHASHASQGSQSHAASRAELHRWHLWHVRHEEHLAHLRYLREHEGNRAGAARKASRIGSAVRTAGVLVAAGAVAAAIGTVAATARSQSPGGSGEAGHPATVAVQESVASIPITTASAFQSVNSDVYVEYDDGSASNAQIKGSVPDPGQGEVARLYAQQFPFKSAPELASTVTLNPSSGGSGYSFTVAPTLATRYQVEVFGNASTALPLAISAVTTIYVLAQVQYPGYVNCASHPTCHQTLQVTIHVPPSVLGLEMAKRRYLYLGYNLVPAGETASYPATMPLSAAGTISGPQRIAADAYRVTISYSYDVGNDASAAYYGLCSKQTEAQDGIGLPGPSACGAQSIPSSAHSVWY